MTDMTMFLKRLPYESGVLVSVRHLEAVLHAAGMPVHLALYDDDADLLAQAQHTESQYLDLQVPSFSDDTMAAIMQLGKRIVLSIHSTLCNLQAEEGVYARLISWGHQYPRLRLTCPSAREVKGMNALLPIRCFYLPNTYACRTEERVVQQSIEARLRRVRRRVSIFCAYRPLKNIVAQIAAVALAAQEIPLELHLLEGPGQNALYRAVQALTAELPFPVIYHASMTNEACRKLAGEMDLGLQVSLSETFSYVACEHMMGGVPVIGSASVPYAALIADYSDVIDIAEKIVTVLRDDEQYRAVCLASRLQAIRLAEKNTVDAIASIENIQQEGKGRCSG